MLDLLPETQGSNDPYSRDLTVTHNTTLYGNLHLPLSWDVAFQKDHINQNRLNVYGEMDDGKHSYAAFSGLHSEMKEAFIS